MGKSDAQELELRSGADVKAHIGGAGFVSLGMSAGHTRDPST